MTWINVKDQLPGTDGLYLVYVPSLSIGPLVAAAQHNAEEASWRSHLTRSNWDSVVTHWQPLPLSPDVVDDICRVIDDATEALRKARRLCSSNKGDSP